jgi:hypothetical protein
MHARIPASLEARLACHPVTQANPALSPEEDTQGELATDRLHSKFSSGGPFCPVAPSTRVAFAKPPALRMRVMGDLPARGRHTNYLS